MARCGSRHAQDRQQAMPRRTTVNALKLNRMLMTVADGAKVTGNIPLHPQVFTGTNLTGKGHFCSPCMDIERYSEIKYPWHSRAEEWHAASWQPQAGMRQGNGSRHAHHHHQHSTGRDKISRQAAARGRPSA